MADPLPLPPTPEQPPAKQGKAQLGLLASLLPLLSIAAAKGGREGMSGFLQGYQQAKQQREQGQQQQQQFAGQQQMQQAQISNLQADNARADAAAKQSAQEMRLKTMQSIQGGFGNLDTPEQIDQYIQAMGPFAQQQGIELGALQAVAPKPTALQKKAAEKRIAALKSQFGEQKWMEQGAQFTHDLSNGEKGVPFQKVLEYAGYTADPNAPPLPQKADVPNTPEEYFYQRYAIEHGVKTFGELPTVEQAKAREQWAKSGRQGETEASAVDLSGSGLDMAAKMYALTGQLPPMGMGQAGAAARGRIINRAAQYNSDTDTFVGASAPPDIASNKASYTANSQSLTQITKNLNAVEAFEATANKNAQLLDGVLNKLPGRSSVTVLNRPIRALAGVMGNEDIASFNALRLSVQNEYARLISNPNLAGVMSDQARREMEEVLRPDATVGQLRAAIKTLASEAANRRDSFRAQRDQIQGQLRGGGATTPAAAQPAATGETPYQQYLRTRGAK